jgi:hypothetical protein
MAWLIAQHASVRELVVETACVLRADSVSLFRIEEQAKQQEATRYIVGDEAREDTELRCKPEEAYARRINQCTVYIQ